MKRLLIVFATLAVTLPMESIHAGPPEGDRGPRVGGDRGPRAGGDRGPRFGGDQARRRPGAEADRPEMDPAKLVARMMQQFDTDGDQKLDAKELTALFGAMRERRGMGAGGPGGFAGSGGPEARRGFGGPNRDRGGDVGGERSLREAREARFKKRGPANDTDNAQPGGERPQRPDAS